MVKELFKVGSGYIRKNKDAYKGDRESPLSPPLFKGPLRIGSKDYALEVWPANGEWGKQDLFIKVYIEKETNKDEFGIL